MEELQPPRKSVELEDPGAHDLDGSSDDHFSDAQEGQAVPDRSGRNSPIPITRVERVDDEPTYGEIPGTPAYKMRMQDAVPDEIEVVPDGQRSRSTSRAGLEHPPWTPGGTPIPKTVVEKVDPEEPSYGDVPGTAAHSLRKADAQPDVILRAPQLPNRGQAPALRPPEQPPIDSISDTDEDEEAAREEEDDDDDDDEDDDHEADDNANDFGDDFDEFEEGEEGGDDDFGDFDDGFQEGQQGGTALVEPREPVPVPIAPSVPPILDFTDLETPESIAAASSPYVHALFPSLGALDLDPSGLPAAPRSMFLSDRSLSLWAQLVAPPPLQPPNWVRSRIRRLFLVSLGVPVDLDEILPASKQKKLVLPSISLPGDRSPRPSSDRPAGAAAATGAVERLRRSGANDSNASLDSNASSTTRAVAAARGSAGRKKGAKAAPELDLRATAMLCATTDEALRGFTDAELRAHVKRLEELSGRAKEALEYWEGRKKSAEGDKEAFEGVIENLVKHAKKVRK